MTHAPATDAAGGLPVWLNALHAGSSRLAATVASLSEQDLRRPSKADRWSIAQVLSHLGSAAEISTGLLERGIAGDERGPSRQDMEPVWERWNALPPLGQREAWQAADARHLHLLDSLDTQQQRSVRIPYFAGLLSAPVYAGLPALRTRRPRVGRRSRPRPEGDDPEGGGGAVVGAAGPGRHPLP